MNFKDKVNKCSLCRLELDSTGYPSFETELYRYECKRCGNVFISREMSLEILHIKYDDIRYVLSGITRYKKEFYIPEIPILRKNLKDHLSLPFIPKNISDNLELIIHYFGKFTKFFGQPVNVNLELDYPIGFCLNSLEFINMLNQLDDQKLLRTTEKGKVYILTLEGFNKSKKLKTKYSEIINDMKNKKNEKEDEVIGNTPIEFKENIPVSVLINSSLKVFISYSWDDEKHKEWVLNLANDLSEHAHIFLDQYDLKPGKIINLYVEEKIRESDKVLIIMTPQYASKADKREKGAGYEYSIINTDLASNLEIYKNEIKYIPILRIGEANESVPTYLKQFHYHDMTTDSDYIKKFLELTKILFDVSLTPRPSFERKIFVGKNISVNDSPSIVNLVKNLIFDPTKQIEFHEQLIIITERTIQKLCDDKYLKLNDLPNSESFQYIINEYEKDIDELLDVLIILSMYLDKKNFQLIVEIFFKLIERKEIETDGYGYIWRHISDYPSLLLFYVIGIFCLKKDESENLFNLTNINVKKRSYDGNTIHLESVSLIERINSYHIFNRIDGHNIYTLQYLKDFNWSVDIDNCNNALLTNNMIYNLLKNKLSKYFLNEINFSNWFDLFEFFTGLVFMDIRLMKQWIKFAPYGRNFIIYSGYGRNYNTRDTIVHKFIEDTRKKKNGILYAGFFGGKLDRFENALVEYQNFLREIR